MTERKNDTSPEIEDLSRRQEELQPKQAEAAEGGGYFGPGGAWVLVTSSFKAPEGEERSRLPGAE